MALILWQYLGSSLNSTGSLGSNSGITVTCVDVLKIEHTWNGNKIIMKHNNGSSQQEQRIAI